MPRQRTNISCYRQAVILGIFKCQLLAGLRTLGYAVVMVEAVDDPHLLVVPDAASSADLRSLATFASKAGRRVKIFSLPNKL